MLLTLKPLNNQHGSKCKHDSDRIFETGENVFSIFHYQHIPVSSVYQQFTCHKITIDTSVLEYHTFLFLK